jgi:hypothetical protein
MSTVAQSDLGNTRAKSRNSRGRRFCLTLNNYTDTEYKELNEWLTQKSIGFCVGKEIGEQGTPHLQIYFECKNQMRFSTIKKFNQRLHIEKAKASREKNIEYCSKEGDFICTFVKEKTVKEIIIEKRYTNIIWKDWQKKIIDILESEPDARSIYWVYDPIGNKGKTFLAKYIAIKYDALICSGKTNDIFNQLNNWRNDNKNTAQIPPCIVDITRSEFCHCNYAALEAVKTGLVYSGKYEGGTIIGTAPHVIVFANYMYDETKMSEDRWKLIEI